MAHTVPTQWLGNGFSLGHGSFSLVSPSTPWSPMYTTSPVLAWGVINMGESAIAAYVGTSGMRVAVTTGLWVLDMS